MKSNKQSKKMEEKKSSHNKLERVMLQNPHSALARQGNPFGMPSEACGINLRSKLCLAMPTAAKRVRIFEKLIIILLILSLSSTLAYALPMPHGIKGTIYDLDGMTQVPFGTLFSINDTTSDHIIEGITGRGKNSGKYSATINGNDGDTIIIKTWNKYNTAKRTIILNGVMNNLNLLLNMTYPNNPPVVISAPIIQAESKATYSYQILAEDLDNDSLSFFLFQSPESMMIGNNSGIIVWTPTDEQIGNHTVIAEISDSKTTILHEFIISVSKKPNPTQPNSGSGGSSRQEELLRTIIFPDLGKTVERITLTSRYQGSIDLMLTESNTKQVTAPIEKTVYKYLTVIPKQVGSLVIDNLIIRFRVEKGWLSENVAKPEHIILNIYKKDQWKTINAKITEEKEGYIIYESESKDFGYFAISLNKISVPKRAESTSPEIPYELTGIIYESEEIEVQENTKVIAENKNSKKSSEDYTGIGNHPGGYSILTYGKIGDEITLNVGGYEIPLILKGDMENLNLVLNKNIKVPLTEKTKYIAILILSITNLVVVGYIGRVMLKKQLNKKKKTRKEHQLK